MSCKRLCWSPLPSARADRRGHDTPRPRARTLRRSRQAWPTRQGREAQPRRAASPADHPDRTEDRCAMSFIDVEVLSHCYNPNPRTKLSLVGVGNGAHTTAGIVNGKIRVTPAPGWRGVDQIPYTITDGAKRSSSKVVLTVTSTGTSTSRSGLPWASGVAVPANGLNSADITALLQQIHAWELYRGRKADIYNSKSNNATWDNLVSSITAKAGMYQALYDEGIAIEQVIDFIADTPGVSGNALQACANGS